MPDYLTDNDFSPENLILKDEDFQPDEVIMMTDEDFKPEEILSPEPQPNALDFNQRIDPLGTAGLDPRVVMGRQKQLDEGGPIETDWIAEGLKNTGKGIWDQGFKRPALDFNSAVQMGMASSLQPLATAYDYYADKITQATGLGDIQKKRGLQVLTDNYVRFAKESSEKGIKPTDGISKFNKAVYKGLGSAFAFIPKAMLAAQIPILGGASLGIVSGMEATPKGWEEASKAAVKGTFLQQYLKGISLLPRAVQAPTAFTIFAGSSAMEGANPEEIIASGMIGVGLSMASKAPSMKEFKSRYQKPDTLYKYKDQVKDIIKSGRFSDLRIWAKQTKFLLNRYGKKSSLIKEIELIMKKDGNAVTAHKANQIAEDILNLWSKQVSIARTRGVGVRLKTPQELLVEGKKVIAKENQVTKSVSVEKQQVKIDNRKFNKGRKKSDTELAEAGKISSLMRRSKVSINKEILDNFKDSASAVKALKKRSNSKGIDFNVWAGELRSSHPILKDKSDMELAQMVIDQERGQVQNIVQSEAQLDKEYKEHLKKNINISDKEVTKVAQQEIKQENWDDEEQIEDLFESGIIKEEAVAGTEVVGEAEELAPGAVLTDADISPEEIVSGGLEKEAKKYKVAEEFVYAEKTIPIEMVSTPVSREQIIEATGKIGSKTPDAPIVVHFEDGKIVIRDGNNRYYQKLDSGAKEITVVFTPENDDKLIEIWNKAQGEVPGIKTKAQKIFAAKEPEAPGVVESVSMGVAGVSITPTTIEDTSGNLETPDGRTVTPEELADISQKVSDSVSGAGTVDAPPPTDNIEGVTPEEPEIPALGKIQGFVHQIKYWLGTKEERWQVGLGAEKGRQIFELIRYFDRASALVKSLTEKRNKKLFFKIDKKTRIEIFDVLKGIQGVDENGTVEFGALQPAGDFKPGKEEGEGVTYAAGETLEDGRIIGREVDEGVYATYRVYNTQKRYDALVAGNPKARGIIAQYFALNEDIEQTILGVDLPAFSTAVMKNQYQIKSMHPDQYTYVPGLRKEERIFSKIKNIFKSYTPSGKMRKSGRLASTGLEEKDLQIAYTVKQQGFTHEFLYNNMVGNILAIVLEPIEGGVVKSGYTKININHPRIAAITDLKADLFVANGINPDDLSLYQYPSFIDSEFDISSGTAVRFADPRTQKAWELSKDIAREMGRAITTNYLIKPSTANRNFVSGFEQYALKPLTHFYEGLLGGGFNPLIQDVFGLGRALTPSSQKMIPEELLGGVFVSDLTNKKSMFHYPLMPFRAIEFYFKRASALADLNTKMWSDFQKKKKSGEISKNTKYKTYKEENMQTLFRDMFQTISDNADSVTYDYWNKPRLLELLPKPMIPFPNYSYHKSRLYIEYSPLALGGWGKKNHPMGGGKPDPKTGKRKKTWSEIRRDIAKSLAGITAWTIAWKVAIDMAEQRKQEMEELALKQMEFKFDTSGRLEFYADEDVALWVRAYDQPFIGDAMYWLEILEGREDFSAWIADAISLGPLLKVPALLIGLKNKYERYKPTSAAVGEQIAGWIPFGAYIRLMRITVDPKKRKTYSNDYNAFRNFVDPVIDVIPGVSKALPERIPTRGPGKGEVRRFSIPEEYIKMLFLNVKRIDKKEYEEWFTDQVYGGKARRRQKNLDKKLSDKETNDLLDSYWSAP